MNLSRAVLIGISSLGFLASCGGGDGDGNLTIPKAIYFKASNTQQYDGFGNPLSLSADGNTMAVGAEGDDSDATGVDGDQNNNSAGDSGAVYVFARNSDTWSQQAYIKASNTESHDGFGADFIPFQKTAIRFSNVSLSGDGSTMAVGAPGEDSNATGIDGDQGNNLSQDSGAVYVFARTGSTWTQQSYIKASNTEIDSTGGVIIGPNISDDYFGSALAISGDGNTLAVAAIRERSQDTGINGDETDNSAQGAGAVYVFVRSGGTWTQEAFVKASNSEAYDAFGTSVSLSFDGNTLAVGAEDEASKAIGIDGDQSDNSLYKAGAVYVFSRSLGTWVQQAYIKASDTNSYGGFGTTVSLSADGNTLAAGGKTGSGLLQGAYVFIRNGRIWTQQGHISEPSNQNLEFADSLSLSADGNVLALNRKDLTLDKTSVELHIRSGSNWSFKHQFEIPNSSGKAISISGDGIQVSVGAEWDSSNATGINGDQQNTLAPYSGAVYLF